MYCGLAAGLALAGKAFGYDCIIVLGENQSEEKKAMLRQSGAILVEVPAVPFKNPNNFVHVAERCHSTLKSPTDP